MANKKLTLDSFTESLAGFKLYQNNNLENDDKERKRKLNLLKKVIDGELTPKQKMCFLLYYVEMKKMADISQILGIDISCVSRHIKKGKDRIKKTIGYYYVM